MKKTYFRVNCCLLAAALSVSAASAETISQIETDWRMQLSLSGRSIEQSIEDVLGRGRALAKDLETVGDESARCLKILDEVELRLAAEMAKIISILDRVMVGLLVEQTTIFCLVTALLIAKIVTEFYLKV